MPNEFIDGQNRITVDIRERDGTLSGPGPLMTCLDLTCDTLLSQSGSFSARFPANDPRLAYVQLKRHRLDFYLDGDLVFLGLAESWQHEIDQDGLSVLVISGRDQLAELGETAIKVFDATDEDEPQFDVPEQLVLYDTLEATGVSWGWTGSNTETGVYGDFSGESVLSALTRIADRIGEAFRLDGARGLRWIGTTPTDSGARAIQGAGDAIAVEDNPRVCLIQHLTERRNASPLLTTIYPYGSGLGETQLDIEGTSRTAPSGYTVDEAANSITSAAALAYIGARVGRRVNFKEIRPLFNTDADIQYAKDYLFDVAVAYLQRNDSTDDFVEYDLEVTKLPSAVKVGTSLRVIYQDERYDLDTDLIVLGIRTTIDRDGAARYSLTVATTNQWHLSESNNLVAQMEEGEIFTAHPQIDANSYWENFREEIGDDQTNHIAEMPFILSEEILTIRQVLFRYKVDAILTGTNEYAYDNVNTDGSSASATAGTNTTATADTNTANSGETAAGTTVSGGSDTSGAVSTAATAGSNTTYSGDEAAGSTESGGNSNSGLTAAGTTTSGGSGTTTSTAPGTTGDGGGGNTGSYTVITDVPSPDSETAGPTSYAFPSTHTHDFGHTHSETSGHVHTGSVHNHTITHEHTTPAHTHEITATHSHTTPNHVHTISSTHKHTIAHTHDMPHTHSTPAHTHTISATHTHTIAHTHDMPHTHNMPHVHGMADLVETFVVKRAPALSSYVLADLEYSVNGGGWVALNSGTPVAGGYYQADITSSVQDSGGLKRPLQEDNLIQVRRTTAAGTGKTALIRVKIGVRCTIQSIVQYS